MAWKACKSGLCRSRFLGLLDGRFRGQSVDDLGIGGAAFEEFLKHAAWETLAGFFGFDFAESGIFGFLPGLGEAGGVHNHGLLGANVDFQFTLECLKAVLGAAGVDLEAEVFVFLAKTVDLLFHLSHVLGFDLELVGKVSLETLVLALGLEMRGEGEDVENCDQDTAPEERIRNESLECFPLWKL